MTKQRLHTPATVHLHPWSKGAQLLFKLAADLNITHMVLVFPGCRTLELAAGFQRKVNCAIAESYSLNIDLEESPCEAVKVNARL